MTTPVDPRVEAAAKTLPAAVLVPFTQAERFVAMLDAVRKVEGSHEWYLHIPTGNEAARVQVERQGARRDQSRAWRGAHARKTNPLYGDPAWKSHYPEDRKSADRRTATASREEVMPQPEQNASAGAMRERERGAQLAYKTGNQTAPHAVQWSNLGPVGHEAWLRVIDALDSDAQRPVGEAEIERLGQVAANAFHGFKKRGLDAAWSTTDVEDAWRATAKSILAALPKGGEATQSLADIALDDLNEQLAAAQAEIVKLSEKAAMLQEGFDAIKIQRDEAASSAEIGKQAAADAEAETSRWKKQSDDWQKRGWELGNECDRLIAELAALKAAQPRGMTVDASEDALIGKLVRKAFGKTGYLVIHRDEAADSTIERAVMCANRVLGPYRDHFGPTLAAALAELAGKTS